MAEHVYHWKHGWVPLDHTAALSKAKGNHEKAAAMLHDAHTTGGIHSHQDVAKAALGVTHLPSADQPAAMRQVQHAAAQHGAQDLLPASLADKRAERAAQTPREIHDRLQSNPSKVTMDELQRLSKLGGKFASAANAEIARRDGPATIWHPGSAGYKPTWAR